MRKRKIYDDKLQIDYFSDSYLKFEEDFYRYSAMDIPLTFLTDDIMREVDSRTLVRQYRYLGND